MVPVFCAVGGQSASVVKNKTLLSAFILLLSVSSAFALTVPTAGSGFSLYNVVNTLYTTGLGYAAAGIMVFIGATDLPKNWKLGLGWMTGGLVVGAIPTITTSMGLVL